MLGSTLYAEVSNNRCFNGQQKVLLHTSHILGCDMKFGIYIPDHLNGEKLPILFYLSGISCTEANFIEKSGFQRFASLYKIIVVNCDTSPRGVRIEGDSDGLVGLGASFYLDATMPKWSKHYKMYSYFTAEFVPFIFRNFPVNEMQCGIFGHSMGGHGALTIGLRNPSVFKSISVFAPVCTASTANISKAAYAAYLGSENTKEYAKYDAVEVAKAYDGPLRKILIDQGTNDIFDQSEDLSPKKLIAVKNPNIEWNFNWRQNYEHGYYFISTFIENHFKFHISNWS